MLDLCSFSKLLEKTGRIIAERETEVDGVSVRAREVRWLGNKYFIVDVNGDTCRLERIRREPMVDYSKALNTPSQYKLYQKTERLSMHFICGF